jgi:hypothetical protein
MLIADISAAIVLHTDFAVKDNFVIPMMIVTKVLFNRSFIGIDDLMDFEQILDGWKFLLYFKLEHGRLKYLL